MSKYALVCSFFTLFHLGVVHASTLWLYLSYQSIAVMGEEAVCSPEAFAFIMAACSEALLISHFEASSRDRWGVKEDHFDRLRLFLHICRQLSF